jgi:hypothetical protein
LRSASEVTTTLSSSLFCRVMPQYPIAPMISATAAIRPPKPKNFFRIDKALNMRAFFLFWRQPGAIKSGLLRILLGLTLGESRLCLST